jgi:hypothetical protein
MEDTMATRTLMPRLTSDVILLLIMPTLLFLVTVIGTSIAATSSVNAYSPGYAPSCNGQHGAKLSQCQKVRAQQEAQAQKLGAGGRAKGAGPKYKDCVARANSFSVDSATVTATSHDKDC